jgi:hypothetical protein
MWADVKNKRSIVTVTSYATILRENIDLFPNIDVFNVFLFMHGAKRLRVRLHAFARTHTNVVRPEGYFKLL